MLFLQIMSVLMVVLLGIIFALLNANASQTMTVIHQLEYLGAPVKLQNGKLIAEERPDDEEHEIRKRVTRDN